MVLTSSSEELRAQEFFIANINTSQENRAASARAFVHSLNILIKYTRMYGFEHKRTEAQFEVAWNELQQGLPTAGDAGFLLGVSDNKLLLDGIPLETGQAERSFAQLLTAAGLASLHFSKDVTVEDFTRLVRAFTLAGSKAQDVAKQIKEALNASKNGTIKINEVKFVAADPLTGDVGVAAQIAAQTLGPEFKQWLNDPQKLLQLIAAAEGANSGSGQAAPGGVPQKQPHYITVDMGTTHRIGGFTYLPRQDGLLNGVVEKCRFETSEDGVNWVTNIAEGSFANIQNNPSLQEASFAPVNARYSRFTSLRAIWNSGWTSAAEISVVPADRSGN